MRTILQGVTILLLLALPAAAQNISGSISGEIQDPSGLPLPAASVTLVNAGTSAQLNAKTSDLGYFEFLSLTPGAYSITVEASGFKKLTRTGLALSANQRLSTGPMQLEVGSVTESVTISGRVETVQTVSAERSANLTRLQLDNLQSNSRDPVELIILMPGIISTGGYTGAFQAPEALREYTVLGGRGNNKNFTVDGVSALNTMTNNQTSVTPNMDAVEEIQVQLSNYQAEYGRSAGPSMNFITRSGTQEFHGGVYLFLRNEALNANGFLNNKFGTPKSKSRTRTQGFTLGGPLYIPRIFNTGRTKLFFFFSESQQPVDLAAAALQQISMPTELERNGDFSETRNQQGGLIAIRDPATGQLFSGNRIPANRLNSFGAEILRMFPAPNTTDPLRRFNFQRLGLPFKQPRREEILKVDYNVSQRFTFYGRYVHDGNDRVRDFISNYSLANTRLERPGRNLSFRGTQAFSPHLVNEATFGYNHVQSNTRPETAEDLKNVQRSTYNIRLAQLNAGINPDGQVPAINFGGLLSGVTAPNIGQPFNAQKMEGYSFIDNLSKVSGRHTFKLGVYYERNLTDDSPTSLYSGSLNFGVDTLNPGNAGHPYANAILGNYTTYSEVSARQLNRYRFTNLEWYAQDNWRVTRKLTLDYGLRFYLHPPEYEQNNGIAGFDPARYDRARTVRLYVPFQDPTAGVVARDPATGTIVPRTLTGAIVPGSGNFANGMALPNESGTPRGLYKSRGVHFGPRVGFAFDPFGKGDTAIRGGFGIFYDRIHGRLISQMAANPPLIANPVIYYGNLSTLQSSSGVVFPQAVSGVSPSGEIPTVMNLSLGVQQRVSNLFVIDVAYVGSLPRHLLEVRDYNTTPFGTNFKLENENPTARGRALPSNFLRPFPGYDAILMTDFSGSGSFHSLQTQVKRRFGRRFNIEGVWTWSKNMAYGNFDTDTRSFLLPGWRDYGKASSSAGGNDATHALNINWIYEVPHLSPHLGGNKVLAQILDNWQLSGLTHFISGFPFPMGLVAPGLDFTGSTEPARVNLLANPILPRGQRGADKHFNTAAIAMPRPGVFGVTRPENVDYGNAPRDVYRSPGINDWKMSVAKTFPIYEKHRLQFRAEFYNLFNHGQFRRPNNNATFNAAGAQVNNEFGVINNVYASRQVQFGLRYTF